MPLSCPSPSLLRMGTDKKGYDCSYRPKGTKIILVEATRAAMLLRKCRESSYPAGWVVFKNYITCAAKGE